MKFFALIASVAAVKITTDPITRDPTVDAAVQNHNWQAIDRAIADD